MILEALFVLFLFALNPVLNKYMLKYISVKSLVLITGLAYFWVALFFVFIFVFMFYDKELLRDFQNIFYSLQNNGKYLWLIVLMLPIIHMITHYYYFSLIRDYKTYYITAIIASYPLVTALLGYIILNETFTFEDIIGIIFIIIGISILNMRNGMKIV